MMMAEYWSRSGSLRLSLSRIPSVMYFISVDCVCVCVCACVCVCVCSYVIQIYNTTLHRIQTIYVHTMYIYIGNWHV